MEQIPSRNRGGLYLVSTNTVPLQTSWEQLKQHRTSKTSLHITGLGRSSGLAQDCCQPFQSPRRITHRNCHSPRGNNFLSVPRIWAVKAMAGQELSQGAVRERVKPDVKERNRRLKRMDLPLLGLVSDCFP